MYNEKLEALITAALADGVLTDKEKNLLFKKAEAMGIDRDEFELVLEGRLAKRKKEMEAQAPQAAKPAKKKGAIPQELDDLIKEYLTDGIISVKERQVLLNKAQALGLNVDEVDLYIDAQQQKADQAVAAAVNKRRGKTCPYCGSSIPDLTDKCPNCGANITPEASKELEEIIEHLESALVAFKSGDVKSAKKSKAEVERYVRKAKMYYGNNPKVQKLLEDIQVESEEVETKRKKKTKTLTIGIGVILIFLIVLGFILNNNYKLKNDPITICNKVESLVKEKNFKEAETIMTNYGEHRVSVFQNELKPGVQCLKDGLIENGEYDKVFDSFCIQRTYGNELTGFGLTEKYPLMIECLNKMKGNMSDNEIKTFIDKQLSDIQDWEYERGGDWEKNKVLKRLYEAGGIK